MEKTVLNSLSESNINLQNIKDLIKNIAVSHSQEISKEPKIVLTDKREFDVVKTAQTVMSLDQFKSFDHATVKEEIKILEDSLKGIMESNILVIDQGIKKLVPLPYEVLSLIFICTNEKFRQHYFHELVEYYYYELNENMKKCSLSKILEKGDFDQQVKILLPIIKFEAALRCFQSKDSKNQTLLTEIISNIISFLKYPRLNQEDIFVVVSNKLNSKSYEILAYELIPLDERNGHLGDYFKLKINVAYGSRKETLNLFAKFLTPKLEIMKEILKEGPSKKEEFFYMTYLPLLQEHGLQSLLDFAPKCYFSRLNDVLILDDMISLGFTALTPNIKLDYDALLFIVKKIARFHACSMILEEILSQKAQKTVTLLDNYENYLKEVLFIHSNIVLNDTFDRTVKLIHYLVEQFPEYTKIIATNELEEQVNSGWNILFERVKKSEKFKNTICHGDAYVSNMLFKFDINGKCQDVTLLDFQILRYCPPVHDLLFFIYQNSFKDTRDQHYRDLVDTYYLELSKHFKNFNFDLSKTYSKEEFEESLIYMKPQAIFHSIFYSQTNMIDPDLREEIFQNEELANKYFHEDNVALIDLGLESDSYRKAMGELVQDFVDLYKNGNL